MIKIIYALAFILSGLIVSNELTFASTISLFENGKPIENYDQDVGEIKSGDTLKFENGARYKVIKKLGGGDNTIVFEVRDLKKPKLKKTYALRIAKRVGRVSYYSQGKEVVTSFKYKDLITIFAKNADNFKKLKLAPKLYDFLIDQYVLVEVISEKFNLRQLLREKVELSPAEQKKAFKKLYEFTEKISAFEFIGDFHDEQLVFDGKKWILLDYVGQKFFEGSHTSETFLERHPFNENTDLFFRGASQNQKVKIQIHLDQLAEAIYKGRIKIMAEEVNPIAGSRVTFIHFAEDPLGDKIVKDIENKLGSKKMCKDIAL